MCELSSGTPGTKHSGTLAVMWFYEIFGLICQNAYMATSQVVCNHETLKHFDYMQLVEKRQKYNFTYKHLSVNKYISLSTIRITKTTKTNRVSNALTIWIIYFIMSWNVTPVKIDWQHVTYSAVRLRRAQIKKSKSLYSASLVHTNMQQKRLPKRLQIIAKVLEWYENM